MFRHGAPREPVGESRRHTAASPDEGPVVCSPRGPTPSTASPPAPRCSPPHPRVAGDTGFPTGQREPGTRAPGPCASGSEGPWRPLSRPPTAGSTRVPRRVHAGPVSGGVHLNPFGAQSQEWASRHHGHQCDGQSPLHMEQPSPFSPLSVIEPLQKSRGVRPVSTPKSSLAARLPPRIETQRRSKSAPPCRATAAGRRALSRHLTVRSHTPGRLHPFRQL
jgi:hypothetical protein